jgi:hypothetical protein
MFGKVSESDNLDAWLGSDVGVIGR